MLAASSTKIDHSFDLYSPRREEQMGEQFLGKKVDSSEEEGIA